MILSSGKLLIFLTQIFITSLWILSYCSGGVTVSYKITHTNTTVLYQLYEEKLILKECTIYLMPKDMFSTAVFGTSPTSMMELFVKIENGLQPLAIFTKKSIVDMLLGSKYVSVFWVFQFFRIHFTSLSARRGS